MPLWGFCRLCKCTLYLDAECGNIGDKFSLYFSLHLSSKLEENKLRFVNHWNNEHVSLQGPKTTLEQSDQVATTSNANCLS